MSYANIEQSVDGGRVRSYFEFIYGQGRGDVYRYTGSTEVLITGALAPVIANRRSWQPWPMKHGPIHNSGSLDKASLEVTSSGTVEVARLFLVAPPSRQVQLNIYRGHIGDNEFRRIWSGRVLTAAWEDGEVKFSCEPVSTSTKRVGLRRNYQYGCPHVLYGSACGLSRSANTATGTIVTVLNQSRVVFRHARRAIVLSPRDTPGGVFTLTLADGREIKRAIVGSASGGGTDIVVTLIAPVPELAVGSVASLSRGCGHNWDACLAFGNTVNYGGCPNIPSKNPFVVNTF